VPVITSTISSVAALSTESVSYLDVGIKLEVEPIIQMEDVQIKASLEVSSIVNTLKTNSGSTVYQLGTRNAATTLTLRDGETQVLAGLIQRSQRGNSARIPGLGDLPVLGRAFSSEATDSDKTEVLLSITPHIVRSLERPADALLRFKAGSEGGRRISVASAIEPPRPSVVTPRPAESDVPPAAGVVPGAAGLGGAPASAPSVGSVVTKPDVPAAQPRYELPPGVGTSK
jgi:general secretion pathway protein D